MNQAPNHWRSNTLATKPGSRHEAVLFDIVSNRYRQNYVPPAVPDRWTAAQLVMAVLIVSATVVGLALAIGGAA